MIPLSPLATGAQDADFLTVKKKSLAHFHSLHTLSQQHTVNFLSKNFQVR